MFALSGKGRDLKSSSAFAFYEMLKTLFANPCLIIMRGAWRTGKTDTSLLIAHLGLKWKLIERVASNIWTFPPSPVEYVTSMGGLRRFLWGDKLTKLYIFDETLTHLYRRRAMSVKNVDILTIIPELSKAHGRMIFITQTSDIDTGLFNPTFLRATMSKGEVISHKTVLTVKSQLFESETFSPIPRSPIRFDADKLAEFTTSESVGFDTLSLEGKAALLYRDGLPMPKIAEKLGVDRTTVRRAVKKVIGDYFNREGLKLVESGEASQSANSKEETSN